MSLTRIRDAKRYIGCILLVASVLTGCQGGSAGGGELSAAKDHLAKNDLAAAAIKLKSYLQTNATSGEARFLLGKVLLEQGEPLAALVEFGKAQDLGFGEPELTSKTARALVVSGKASDVIAKHSGQVLDSPTAQAELRTSIAEAYGRLGKVDEAVKAVDEALAVQADLPWALLTKARLLAVKGDSEGAFGLIDKVIAQGGPSLGEAWQSRGDVAFKIRRDPAGAIAAYQKALIDARRALAVRLSMVHVYMVQRDAAGIKAQLVELKKSHPTAPQTQLVGAQVAYIERDFDRARDLIQSLLRLAPTAKPLLVLAGAVEIERGALVAAETHLGKAVQTSDPSPVARHLLATTYLRMGQGDKALSALRPLLELARANGITYGLAGQAHLQQGAISQAEAAFEMATKLTPDDSGARTALALTDLAKGNADAAFDALQAISTKDRGDTADLALITARLQRRQFDAALQAIDVLEKKSPGKAQAPFLRGQAQRLKGEFDAARQSYAAALKLEPRHEAATLNLAAMDLVDGNVDAARKRLADELVSQPKSAGIRMAVVGVMRRQGATGAEIKAKLVEGVSANPSDATLRVALIEHLIDAGDARSALETAQGAQLAVPDNPEILDALGRAYALQGDKLQAVSTFNQIAALLPRSPGPYLRLAELHSRGSDVNAWAQNLKRAFELAPDSEQVHRHLLTHATRTRDAKLALGAARELQRTRPKLAAGHVLEGDVESVRKNWAGAMTAYRRALDKQGLPVDAPIRLYISLGNLGREAEAERFAADWLRNHPKDVRFLAHLGGVAMSKKDLPTAERRYAELLTIEPKNVLAMNNVAWLMVERRAKDALAMAERAYRAAPGNPLVLDTLAHALATEGQLAKAIEVQRKAVSLGPTQDQYRLHLARLLVRTGDKAGARKELEVVSGRAGKTEHRVEAAELLKSL